MRGSLGFGIDIRLTNANSGGSVVPLAAITAYSLFNQPDTTDLTTLPLDFGGSGNWVKGTFLGSSDFLLNEGCTEVSIDGVGSSFGFCYVNTGISDNFTILTKTYLSDAAAPAISGGLLLCYTDIDNLIWMDWYSSAPYVRLFKRVSGVQTALPDFNYIGSILPANVSGNTIVNVAVTVSGTDLIVNVNGQSKTYTYPVGVLKINNHGILGQAATGTDNVSIDNFTISDSTVVDSQLVRLIMCDGDSIPYGAFVPRSDSWPTLLHDDIKTTTYVVNTGVPSARMPAILADAGTEIDGRFVVGSSSVAILAAGTNDLYDGRSTAATYSDMVTWYTGRKAAGFNTKVCTILPRSAGGTPAGFEADRQTVNGLINANTDIPAGDIVDIGNDATIGQDGDSDNATYYFDQVHLTAAGATIVKDLVKAALGL